MQTKSYPYHTSYGTSGAPLPNPFTGAPWPTASTTTTTKRKVINAIDEFLHGAQSGKSTSSTGSFGASGASNPSSFYGHSTFGDSAPAFDASSFGGGSFGAPVFGASAPGAPPFGSFGAAPAPTLPPKTHPRIYLKFSGSQLELSSPSINLETSAVVQQKFQPRKFADGWTIRAAEVLATTTTSITMKHGGQQTLAKAGIKLSGDVFDHLWDYLTMYQQDGYFFGDVAADDLFVDLAIRELILYNFTKATRGEPGIDLTIQKQLQSLQWFHGQ